MACLYQSPCDRGLVPTRNGEFLQGALISHLSLLLLSTFCLLVAVRLDWQTGRSLLPEVVYAIGPLVMALAGRRTWAVVASLVALGCLAWMRGWPETPAANLALAVNGLLIAAVPGWIAILQRRLLLERSIARHDPVTGLVNRQGFQERLASELSRSNRYGRALTVAFIDCDDFKNFNDRWGHSTGDFVLKQIGRHLQANVRPFDCVARIGGDEFAILVSEAGGDAARLVIERLREGVKEALQTQFATITLSIGVVTFDKPPATIEECLRAADVAMYEVKRHGKDGIRFEVAK